MFNEGRCDAGTGMRKANSIKSEKGQKAEEQPKGTYQRKEGMF